MNRKWMMIFSLTLALAFTALQGMAQTSPNQTPPDQSVPNSTSPSAAQSETDQGIANPELAGKVQAKLQQISTELGLSDDQKSQLKPILQEEFKQLKAIKDDTTLGLDEKKVRAKGIQNSAREQMKQILTPDQQKKLAELREDNDQ